MAPPAGGNSLAKIPVPARFALGALLLGLFGVGYWLVFYSEFAQKMEQTKRERTKLKGDLAEQQQAQSNYFADRDELALRQQKQREFNKVLPATADAPAFLSAIQQVSNVAGVNLKLIQPLDEVPLQFYAKVPIRLEMKGKFHQVNKFIYEVGKLDRIINVENIELTDPKVVGDEVMMTARCLTTAFHSIPAKK